ncbi:MAG: hypothetical protein ACYC3G_01675 [Minisyncoccota bacterium]
MDLIFSYVLVPFMNWGQYFFYLIILLIAANKRFAWFNFFSDLSYKFLIWLVVGFKVFYAIVETFSQYYVWSGNAFTKLLLDQNIIDFNIVKGFIGKLAWIFDNRFGYFIFYSWGRFWLGIVVSLIAALLFYLFLVFLKKHKERFFDEGETELGFLLALMVGWSNFIVFLPLVFLSVVLVSVFRRIVFKEMYTTLGAPFLLSALIVLLFGKYIVDILGLTMLKV